MYKVGIGSFYDLLLTLLPLQFLIYIASVQLFEVMELWLNQCLGTEIYLAHGDFRFHPFAQRNSSLENILVSGNFYNHEY